MTDAATAPLNDDDAPLDLSGDAPAPEGSDADARIAALEAETAQLKDQALRALAEAENARRRADRDREETAKYAVSNFARETLTVADTLRRALDSVPAEIDDSLKSFIDGVAATERQLLAALERQGVSRIDPTGDRFDPNFHQAMFEVEGTGQAAGTVVQCLQAGFTIHGRLLRAALVGVSKGDPASVKVDTTA